MRPAVLDDLQCTTKPSTLDGNMSEHVAYPVVSTNRGGAVADGEDLVVEVVGGVAASRLEVHARAVEDKRLQTARQ